MGQAFSLVLERCEAALTGILFIVYACLRVLSKRPVWHVSLSAPSTSRFRAKTK